MKILFAAPRFPYPLRRGHQVRAFHQIRLLSARHRIVLLAAARRPPAPEAIAAVAPYCEEIVVVPVPFASAAAGAAGALFSGRPVQAAIYGGTALRRRLDDAMRRHRPDLLHVQLARMAPFADRPLLVPRLMDLVDSLSLNMERRFRRDTGPRRWAAFLEWKRMARYEKRIVQTWDHVTVVSPVDRAAIGDAAGFTVNTNGVHLEEFPFAPAAGADATVVFTGNLGYFPNVDAMGWFVERVFPILRRLAPSARLRIAGTRPSARMRRLAARDGVELAAEPDRIGGALAGASVAVAPMRAGSGQLLKILEAMASGVPVVATSLAADAFDFRRGQELLVADDPDAFAGAVARLLADPAEARALARRARTAVEDRYTWRRSVDELEGIYETLLASRAPDGTPIRR